jgi:tRNA A-37 threonylcarbamoyl transferase component Bud32
MTQRTDIPTHRLSVSQLPAEVEQDERDFMRLLEKALAPGYTLVKRLGAGGMGTVYLARDAVLKRLVAVKVMAPALAADPAARARFEREAQAVASISHPNVVAVYSVGSLENGVPYLVMQYVEGRTMAQRLQQEGPLDARSAKRVIGEVASAIAAAHRKNVVHRDIKPANILLDEENGRAMVTDFGIAAVLERTDDREAVQITHTGVVVGTPANMSPEQLLAEPITAKTDIYSLGVLGYELFIGEGPYQISSPREVMAAHLRDTPRKLSKLRPDIDPELERLLEECLAKEPGKRPGAAEVEKRLQHGATVLLEWPPPGTEALAGKLRTATRFLHFGAAGFALPAVALAAFDRASTLRQALPPVLVLFAITGIGFLVFVVGLEGLRRFVRDARKLVAAGYGWGTVLEAAADQRGDTGALIAGGREYAELALEERSSMRRNRVLVACLRVAAGILPILGFGIGIIAGTRTSDGPTLLLSLSILLAALSFAVASVLSARENSTMRAARQRIRTTSKLAERANQLADVWTQSFEQVRAGQKFGTGPRRFGSVSRVLVGALIAVLLVEGAIVIVALTLTTAFGTACDRAQRTQRLALSFREATGDNDSRATEDPAAVRPVRWPGRWILCRGVPAGAARIQHGSARFPALAGRQHGTGGVSHPGSSRLARLCRSVLGHSAGRSAAVHGPADTEVPPRRDGGGRQHCRGGAGFRRRPASPGRAALTGDHQRRLPHDRG